MKTTALLFFLALPFMVSAQTGLPHRKLELALGRSFHGTGDMRGLIFTTAYSQRLNRRFSWSAAIGGTIHDASDPLYYNDQNGSQVDASFRYTTAGAQFSFDLGYSIIRTLHHDLTCRLGPLVRYQSSSYPDIYSINYPAGTGLPIPVIAFQNLTPQRTLAVGGIGMLQYGYSINNKISIGAIAGLQTDTNGDTLTQLAFTIGRLF
jgi:hypothetical protein